MVHHKMSDPPDRSPFQVLKHRSCCLRSGCLSRCWVTSCTRHLSALSNQPGCFPQFLVLRTKSKDDLCNCYMYIYMYICPCLCVFIELLPPAGLETGILRWRGFPTLSPLLSPRRSSTMKMGASKPGLTS